MSTLHQLTSSRDFEALFKGFQPGPGIVEHQLNSFIKSKRPGLPAPQTQQGVDLLPEFLRNHLGISAVPVLDAPVCSFKCRLASEGAVARGGA